MTRPCIHSPGQIPKHSSTRQSARSSNVSSDNRTEFQQRYCTWPTESSQKLVFGNLKSIVPEIMKVESILQMRRGKIRIMWFLSLRDTLLKGRELWCLQAAPTCWDHLLLNFVIVEFLSQTFTKLTGGIGTRFANGKLAMQELTDDSVRTWLRKDLNSRVSVFGHLNNLNRGRNLSEWKVIFNEAQKLNLEKCVRPRISHQKSSLE